MRSTELRKRQFIDTTFELLGRTLGASRLVYYSVDDESNLYNFICRSVPSDFLRLYIREMHSYDPLHVRRVASHEERVVRLDQAHRYADRHELAAYRSYLASFDVSDSIDMIFDQDGAVRAGISVMWAGRDRRPGQQHFRLADSLQSYIQFNIQDHLAPSKVDPAVRAMAMFHLTQREAEVAKLLCFGRTNAEIAACLGIGVATVKTHLIHIFDKAGVESRSGLVARLSALT